MNLPKSAEVNRFVAKKKFYEHSNMVESIKNSFGLLFSFLNFRAKRDIEDEEFGDVIISCCSK